MRFGPDSTVWPYEPCVPVFERMGKDGNGWRAWLRTNTPGPPNTIHAEYIANFSSRQDAEAAIAEARLRLDNITDCTLFKWDSKERMYRAVSSFRVNDRWA